VALQHLNLDSHLRPISELDDYTIEKGDQDPRGWSVVTPQGARIGEVGDLIVDTNAMKVRYLVVAVDEGAGMGGSEDRTVLLNAENVELRDSSNEVLATGYGTAGFDSNSGAYAYTRPSATTTADRDQTRLTRSEEELRIGKREVSRGEARVSKHVETEHVREPVTRRREEVVVERRPVEAGARGDASIGQDEFRIPLMEEEVVVEKRPVLKEELIVGKRVVEERDVVDTEVRREKFDVENTVDPSTGGDATRGRRNR